MFYTENDVEFSFNILEIEKIHEFMKLVINEFNGVCEFRIYDKYVACYGIYCQFSCPFTSAAKVKLTDLAYLIFEKDIFYNVELDEQGDTWSLYVGAF